MYIYIYNISMSPRCSGRFCASFLAAFGFNGKLFTGSFDQRDQLDFSQYAPRKPWTPWGCPVLISTGIL